MILLFIVAIPLLIFYASGYRFTLDEDAPIVQTGGIYVASEQPGVSMFIDDELVRETRAFRKALYASGVVAGPHRITVQKDGYHTWVKKIDVYPYLVVDALAFNLPEEPTSLSVATTSDVYDAVLAQLSPDEDESATSSKSTIQKLSNVYEEVATLRLSKDASTSVDQIVPLHEDNGVQLYDEEGEVYARYVGSLSKMPYYYCPKVPERTSLDAAAATLTGIKTPEVQLTDAPVAEVCDPIIKLDRQWQTVTSYDFFPGTTDLVILERADGIFLTEIDNRGFQNTQPIMLGQHLRFTLYNDDIYVYDGETISQIILE